MKDKNKRAAKEIGTRLVIFCTGIVFMGMLVWGVFCLAKQLGFSSPEERLITYMSYIPKKEYDKMYDMLDVEASGKIEREEFIKRNSAIYEGIEIKNLNVKITSYEKKTKKVFYDTTFDTCAGPIRFSNAAEFNRIK